MHFVPALLYALAHLQGRQTGEVLYALFHQTSGGAQNHGAFLIALPRPLLMKDSISDRQRGPHLGIRMIVEFSENFAIVRIHALIHRFLSRKIIGGPSRRLRTDNRQCSATSGMTWPISIAWLAGTS